VSSGPALDTLQLMNARDLELAIDRDAEVPMGVQLAWGLRARVEDGTVRAGARLPGLREVAEATGLNINTVRAAYQRLDQEGLIESRQGSGTFVVEIADAPPSARAIAANAAREARETGVDLRAVAAALYVARDAESKRVEGDSARRRELRSQIAVLERAIGELEAEHPGIAPTPPRGRDDPGPSLLSAPELERVRAVLVRRLASVQEAIDTHLAGAEAGPVASARRQTRATSLRPAVKPAPKPATRSAARGETKRGRRKPAKRERPSRQPGTVRPAGAEA
jgi:DNA-binding transcriptional regulator YhcF (GntR family)